MMEDRGTVTQSSFTDEGHPLACYREQGDLDKGQMRRISQSVQAALWNIKTLHGLDTRAELAAFLGVGKNKPREWERHPERIRARDVERICKLSGYVLEELRDYRVEETRRFTADELTTFYHDLTEEQQETITRMVQEMSLANRYRILGALFGPEPEE